MVKNATVEAFIQLLGGETGERMEAYAIVPVHIT